MHVPTHTPFVALAIYLVIAAARRVGVDRIPERWRWLRPIIMAGLVEMANVLATGETLTEAARYAMFAAIGAMGIHSAIKESRPNE